MINFQKKSPVFLRIFMCILLICTAGFSVTAYAADNAGFYASTVNAFVSGVGGFCWFCPIFGGLFEAMNTLATAVSTKLSHVFLMVMGVGLLFSIAFKVAKMVTQLQPVDLMQFLTDLFKHLGRAIIATALLVSSLSIFTYLVSPILSMSMNLSSIIVAEGGLEGSFHQPPNPPESICAEYEKDMKAIPGPISGQTKAFTNDAKASMLCTLKTMSSGVLFGIILGVCIWSMTFIDLIWGFLPNFMYAILGCIIILAHIAILISFPFKLIDAMIRMAFVCALMPLWIILWVFPATVGYTKKAWDMFVSSCLIFVCMSVVIVLAMTMMTAALGNREAFQQALVNDEFRKAAEYVSLGGKEFFVSVALCYMAWKMLGTATTLANSFTGSMPDLGMGQGASQFAATVGKLGGGVAAAGGRKAMDAIGMKPATLGKMGRVGLGIATLGGSLVAEGAAKGGLWGLEKGAKGVKSAAKGTWNAITGKGKKGGDTPPAGTPPTGQGSPTGQENPTGQGNLKDQGNPTGQGSPTGQGNPKDQGNLKDQGNPTGQGKPTGTPYGGTFTSNTFTGGTAGMPPKGQTPFATFMSTGKGTPNASISSGTGAPPSEEQGNKLAPIATAVHTALNALASDKPEDPIEIARRAERAAKDAESQASSAQSSVSAISGDASAAKSAAGDIKTEFGSAKSDISASKDTANKAEGTANEAKSAVDAFKKKS